jgi:hypothetical protein
MTKQIFGRFSAIAGIFVIFALPLMAEKNADYGWKDEDFTKEELADLRAGSGQSPFSGLTRSAFPDTEDKNLHFADACIEGDKLTITAVGDLLLHSPLQRRAENKAGGFRVLWKSIEPHFANADISYANLEGPVSESNELGTYPNFNYATHLVPDLLASGIDIVSTANNHALDKGSRGADDTVNLLELHRLNFTGTRKRSGGGHWHTITKAKGFSIAWLACTFGTNGIADNQSQVLNCYRDTEEIRSIVSKLSSQEGIDAVIVTPHWGEEYQLVPNSSQKALARQFLEAGALAVIGSHPHVLQTWEKLTINGKEKFVIYSLGNFVSCQFGNTKRTSILLALGLTKDAQGVTHINGVKYIPLFMTTGSVEPMDSLNAGESKSLVAGMFGTENAVRSDQKIVTNSECYH